MVPIQKGDKMATKAITQKLVDSIPLPRQKQQIVRDSGLKGFGLRLTPGGMSFIAEARVNGKSRRMTVGRADLLSVEAARKEAMKMLAEMTSGADPQVKKQKQEASAITLLEVLDQYLTVQKLKLNTSTGYRRKTRDAFPDWMSKPITSITQEMVLARHKALPKPNKYGTSGQSSANTAMKMLLTLINFAINNLGVKMDNPVQILNKNRSWYRLNRAHAVIADHQLPAYWKAVSSLMREKVRDFFLLLLLTGLRRGEAQTLRWENIDFENRTLTIPASVAKNHHEHVLPLSDVLVALLVQRRTKCGDSPWVFPRNDGTKPMAHQTYSSQLIGKKIGCMFSPHAARRTFVTLASRIGIPHHIVKKLVNHIQLVDIASTYVVLTHECLREPMQQITDKFMALMEVDPAEFLPELTMRPIKPPTLAAVLRDYLLKRKLRSSSEINYKKAMRVDLGEWLDLPVTKITEQMVEARKKNLLKRKSPVTVNITLGILRSLLNFAAQNYETPSGKRLIEKNPVRGLTHYHEESFKQSIIDDSLLPAWYAALESVEWKVSSDYLLFVLLTGLRMREAMTLQWSDVDLDAGTLQIRAEVTQNGHGYCLPLSQFLMDFLKQRKALSGESAYVFPGRARKNGHLRSCQRVVDLVSKQIGHKFQMNDLRRTFVQAGLRAGVSGYLMKRLVNQRGTRNSIDKFEQADFDQLREAMEKISARLLGLMNCKNGQKAS